MSSESSGFPFDELMQSIGDVAKASVLRDSEDGDGEFGTRKLGHVARWIAGRRAETMAETVVGLIAPEEVERARSWCRTTFAEPTGDAFAGLFSPVNMELPRLRPSDATRLGLGVQSFRAEQAVDYLERIAAIATLERDLDPALPISQAEISHGDEREDEYDVREEETARTQVSLQRQASDDTLSRSLVSSQQSETLERNTALSVAAARADKKEDPAPFDVSRAVADNDPKSAAKQLAEASVNKKPSDSSQPTNLVMDALAAKIAIKREHLIAEALEAAAATRPGQEPKPALNPFAPPRQGATPQVDQKSADYIADMMTRLGNPRTEDERFYCVNVVQAFAVVMSRAANWGGSALNTTMSTVSIMSFRTVMGAVVTASLNLQKRYGADEAAANNTNSYQTSTQTF